MINIKDSTILMILLGCLLLFCSCQSLSKKQVRIVNDGKGGKITTIDPLGSGTPVPQVVCGQFTSIINTVPPGTIMHGKTTTYQFWSAYKSVEDEIWIDTTKDPVDVRYKRTFFKKEK